MSMTKAAARRSASAGATASAIGIVERETGLSKDTLRVWERRYGFPRPLRDAKGERTYPPEQVEKLRVVRRLMDRGLRPGKLVGASLEELTSLFGAPSAERRTAASESGPVAHYLRAIRSRDASLLQDRLSQDLLRLGVQRFVVDIVAPLSVRVGEAWNAGEMEIFEEHLFSGQVQQVLHQALGSLARTARGPRVLLTTLPGEQHRLGLLMAQACLAVEGAECLSLGPETPAVDIVAAARAHRVDVVGLSFSSAFRLGVAKTGVSDLRRRLDRRFDLWAGGALWSGLKAPLPGVTTLSGLDDIPRALAQWRAADVRRSSSASAPHATASVLR
jgi:DNA-binding transcriptional MerR regulator/methylmalonyl-CoA mutase cobalamin-binding subunit